MTDKNSCLVQKLSYYVDLSMQDQDHLGKLEKDERVFQRHDEVYQGGDSHTQLFVVKTGWLYSYTDLPDGRRQIVKLHHPGDIIGFPDVALEHSTTTLRAAEGVCLCPFPKSALDVILRESPRLSALLLSIALRDQVIFIDLVRAMGRMSARERIGYLLLTIAARLRITNPDMNGTFRLPLTQREIADHLGLTNVYISKSLQRMEEEGYISRDGERIQLLREKDLQILTDFYDRFSEMDTSWFPQS